MSVWFWIALALTAMLGLFVYLSDIEISTTDGSSSDQWGERDVWILYLVVGGFVFEFWIGRLR